MRPPQFFNSTWCPRLLDDKQQQQLFQQQMQEQLGIEDYNINNPNADSNNELVGGVPQDSNELKQFKEFGAKLYGLIAQFASSVSPPLALEILNIGVQAIRSLEWLIAIFEEALHSYFNNTMDDLPIPDNNNSKRGRASSYSNNNNDDREEMLENRKSPIGKLSSQSLGSFLLPFTIPIILFLIYLIPLVSFYVSKRN